MVKRKLKYIKTFENINQNKKDLIFEIEQLFEIYEDELRGKKYIFYDVKLYDIWRINDFWYNINDTLIFELYDEYSDNYDIKTLNDFDIETLTKIKNIILNDFKENS